MRPQDGAGERFNQPLRRRVRAFESTTFYHGHGTQIPQSRRRDPVGRRRIGGVCMWRSPGLARSRASFQHSGRTMSDFRGHAPRQPGLRVSIAGTSNNRSMPKATLGGIQAIALSRKANRDVGRHASPPPSRENRERETWAGQRAALAWTTAWRPMGRVCAVASASQGSVVQCKPGTPRKHFQTYASPTINGFEAAEK